MKKLHSWSRKNRKNGEKLTYVFYKEEHQIEVVRVSSDNEPFHYIFKIGQTYETYAGNITEIGSFFVGRGDSGIYGKGTAECEGVDISLANQIDIIFDNGGFSQHTIDKFSQNLTVCD